MKLKTISVHQFQDLATILKAPEAYKLTVQFNRNSSKNLRIEVLHDGFHMWNYCIYNMLANSYGGG